MENQTLNQEALEAMKLKAREILAEARASMNQTSLAGFLQELTLEEQVEFNTIENSITIDAINELFDRMEETEKRANFAAYAITAAAVAALAVIGTKNVLTDIQKKKARREETDLLIEAYLTKKCTREDLKNYVNKKDRKYVNKMTNEPIFE